MTISICKEVLRSLGIAFNESYIDSIINETPYVHSFLGISIVLNKYNVWTKGIKFKNKLDIRDFHRAFIAYYKGSPMIINVMEDNYIRLLSTDWEETIPIQDFLETWDGSALLYSANKNSVEPGYRKRNLDIKLHQLLIHVMICAIIALCVYGVFENSFNQKIWWIANLLFCILGCAVSYLLIQKDLNVSNPITDKICGFSKSGHCDSVINSEGSKVFGYFKLSEIGTAYFFVSLLTLLYNPSFFVTLSLYGSIGIVFSFWSLWYQKYKAKSWCMLCLIVLVILWLQFITYLFSGFYSHIEFKVIQIGVLCAEYFIALMIIHNLIHLIKKISEGMVWHKKFNMLRYDLKVRDVMQEDAVAINDCKTSSSMYFGNITAPLDVTIFSNPYCGPCADLHKKLHDLPGNVVRIRYVMTYFSDEQAIINKYIIAAYQQLGASKTWEILNEWYSSGKFEGKDFFKGYSLNLDETSVESEFRRQCEWGSNTDLKGTPTILLNGSEVKWPYDIDDLTLLAL